MTRPNSGQHGGSSNQPDGYGPGSGQPFGRYPGYSGRPPQAPYGQRGGGTNHPGGTPFTGSYGPSGAYRGPGVFEDPTPPNGKPPNGRRRLAVALAVAAVLLLVGGVTAGVLLGNREPRPKAASAPSPTPSGGTWTPPPAPQPRMTGWQVGYNPRSQIAYDVPRNWNVLSPRASYRVPALGDITFRGLVNGPSYPCGGRELVVGQVASTEIDPTKPMDRTAVAFARRAGRHFYASAKPLVRVDKPRPVTVDGVRAVRLTATVTMPPSSSCAPAKARIGVLVLRGKESYVAVVAGVDSARGSPRPSAPGDTLVPQILDSVRPVR